MVRQFQIILILIVFGFLQTKGQQKCPGFMILGTGAEIVSSANAHGTFYSPYLSATHVRNSIFLGAMFQKRNLSFSGLKLTYSRNLTGYTPDSSSCKNVRPFMDRFQINFFAYYQYLYNVHLSYYAVKIEEKTHRNNIVNWNETKLTTGEFGSGVEIRYNFSNKLSFRTTIGASLYNHYRYVDGMYNELTAVTLCLGTGVNYSFW